MVFQPVRVEIVFHCGLPGFPWNLYTKLTETLRQIKTTFPMNMYTRLYPHVYTCMRVYETLYTCMRGCTRRYTHVYYTLSTLHMPPKNGLNALQTPRTSRLSTFNYCQVVNRALLRLLSTYILV